MNESDKDFFLLEALKKDPNNEVLLRAIQMRAVNIWKEDFALIERLFSNQRIIDSLPSKKAIALGLTQSPGVHVPTPECPNCHGLRVDNEQYTCRTCNGTGRMP